MTDYKKTFPEGVLAVFPMAKDGLCLDFVVTQKRWEDSDLRKADFYVYRFVHCECEVPQEEILGQGNCAFEWCGDNFHEAADCALRLVSEAQNNTLQSVRKAFSDLIKEVITETSSRAYIVKIDNRVPISKSSDDEDVFFASTDFSEVVSMLKESHEKMANFEYYLTADGFWLAVYMAHEDHAFD